VGQPDPRRISGRLFRAPPQALLSTLLLILALSDTLRRASALARNHSVIIHFQLRTLSY
jgi:hypothetical protein